MQIIPYILLVFSVFCVIKSGNANLNVQFTLYVRTDFIISPYFNEWLISHSRATLAPLLCIKTDLFPFGESPLNSMKGIKVQIVRLTYA